ncbi:Uncharacterised protein [uncultured archaeon]|nr:Uncharacterised protein [uncultured archaeon]
MRSNLSESELESRKRLGERYNTAKELQVLKDRVAGLRIAINLLISEEKNITNQIEQHQAKSRSTEVD